MMMYSSASRWLAWTTVLLMEFGSSFVVTHHGHSRSGVRMMETARIEFVRGVDERVLPSVSVTRSLNSRGGGGGNGNAQAQTEVFFTGTATFWFEKASTLYVELNKERLITGMFLIDEEGSISTTDVSAKFENGRPVGISSVLVLSNPTEWHRFMRFMERFSEEHGLRFTSASP